MPGRKKKSGQALLELVLVLPLIFILVLGMLTISLVAIYKARLEGVAREATRIIVKDTNDSSLEQGTNRAREVAIQYGLNPANLTLSLSGVTNNRTPERGGVIEARASYKLKLFFFPELTISGTNREVVECYRTRDDPAENSSCLPE